ncbi:hypothetical protein [Mycobacterium sp. URHB0021]
MIVFVVVCGYEVALGYTAQVHHAARDWKHGGQSNIDGSLKTGPQ